MKLVSCLVPALLFALTEHNPYLWHWWCWQQVHAIHSRLIGMIPSRSLFRELDRRHDVDRHLVSARSIYRQEVLEEGQYVLLGQGPQVCYLNVG